jgi:hypothetical protein
MELNRMKKGMSFEECLYSVVGENVGLLMAFIATCERAQQLLSRESANFGILTILDAFSLYENDLVYIVKDLCDCDPDSILKIIWSLELGDRLSQDGEEIPFFAKIENIRQMIADIISGKGACFPFKEAEVFIRNNVPVSFA